jgi:hypothetical protein
MNIWSNFRNGIANVYFEEHSDNLKNHLYGKFFE